MANENEMLADIVAQMRDPEGMGYTVGNTANGADISEDTAECMATFADRIEAAWKRERELLRSCARWILTHDIYGHMAQELLAECKKVLGDDGKFLMPKGDMA